MCLSTRLAVACLVLGCSACASAQDDPARPLPGDGSADAPAITVTGTVRSSMGEPVAGAQVVLRAKDATALYTSLVQPRSRDVLARSMTDVQGRFEFKGIGIPLRMEELINELIAGKPAAQVVAWAAGHGFQWKAVRSLNSMTVDLVLPAESILEGKVISAEGQPESGVQLEALGVTPAIAEYSGFLDGPEEFNLMLSQLQFTATTQADGSFQLRHLPTGYRIPLTLTRPGIARRLVIADTSPGGSRTKMRATSGGRQTSDIVRSPATMAVSRARCASVLVTDHQHKPVSQGGVMLIESEQFGAIPVDSNGTALVTLPKPGTYEFQYAADSAHPSLSALVRQTIKDVDAPTKVHIELPEPRWLTGRVVDAETGEGIAGAEISYRSGDPDNPSRSATTSLAMSGSSGFFRIPAVVGKGWLRVSRPLYGYFVTHSKQRGRVFGQAVEVPASGEPDPVELKLSHGLVLRGLLRDAAGQPVEGALVRAENAESHRVAFAKTNAQGQFRVGGLSPYAVHEVSALHAKGGANVTIVADDRHNWDHDRIVNHDLTLEPRVTLTGRVFHAGHAQPGVLMKLYRGIPGNSRASRVFAEETTDEQGRYTVAGLSPGDRYNFEIITADGVAALGWRHQSMETIPKGASGVMELPAVSLISLGQVLAGKVVDRQGNPLSGINVNARLANGQFVTDFGRLRTDSTTDVQGQFELRYLPEEPLELMAWRRSSGETGIRFPSYVRPQLNQLDIRILLDPTLDQPLEDLDAPSKK